jgi:outer membrane phospholipase A
LIEKNKETNEELLDLKSQHSKKYSEEKSSTNNEESACNVKMNLMINNLEEKLNNFVINNYNMNLNFEIPKHVLK